MVQYLPDDHGILNAGDYLGCSTADSAGFHVNVEYPFQSLARKRLASGKETLLRPRQAIDSMISLINGLTIDESGVLYNWAGEILPW
jgi:hypothetical protein